MKEFDYSRVKHYHTYGFIKAVFRPIVKLVYKIEFKGLENIPKDKSNYIVAINHTCALDPVFVAMPNSFLRFISWRKQNFLKIPLQRGL